MAITERFSRLSGISLHTHCIRMRQAHHEEVDLTFLAVNHAKGLAKIHLRMARAMCQRHKHLFGAPLLFAHVIGHRGQTARVSVLVSQTLKNALGRVSLFFDQRFIAAQNLVYNTDVSIKSWTLWCL